MLIIGVLIGAIASYAAMVYPFKITTRTETTTSTQTYLLSMTATQTIPATMTATQTYFDSTTTATQTLQFTTSETSTSLSTATATKSTSVTITSTQTSSTSVTVTQTLSTTTTVTNLLVQPFYEYWTANYSGSLYRQSSPFSFSPAAGDTLTESVFENGSVSLEISQTSHAYYSLGFYYEFGKLSDLLEHPIAINGSGFTVQLWVAMGNWTWTPSGSGERFTGAFGPSGTIGTETTYGSQIIGSSTMFNVAHISTCAPGTYTVAQIVNGACSPISGVNGNSSFALWVGISSDSPGKVAAIINSVSSPYP